MYVSFSGVDIQTTREAIPQISFRDVVEKVFDAITGKMRQIPGIGGVISSMLDLVVAPMKTMLSSLLEKEVKEAIDAEGNVTTLDFGIYISSLVAQLALSQGVFHLPTPEEEEDFSAMLNPANLVVGGMVYLMIFGELNEKNPGELAKLITEILTKAVSEVTGIEATIPEDESWTIPTTGTGMVGGYHVVGGDLDLSQMSVVQAGPRQFAPVLTKATEVPTPVIIGGAAVLAYLLFA